MVAISQMTDKVQLFLATEHKQNYFLKESLVVFPPEKALTRSDLKVFSGFGLFANATIVVILRNTLMPKR